MHLDPYTLSNLPADLFPRSHDNVLEAWVGGRQALTKSIRTHCGQHVQKKCHIWVFKKQSQLRDMVLQFCYKSPHSRILQPGTPFRLSVPNMVPGRILSRASELSLPRAVPIGCYDSWGSHSLFSASAAVGLLWRFYSPSTPRKPLLSLGISLRQQFSTYGS